MATKKIIIPAARARILEQAATQPAVFGAISPALSHDDRLMELTEAAGVLAAWIKNKFPRHQVDEQVLRIASYCYGWLHYMGERQVADRIHAERERQDELIREGRITPICKSPVADPKRKLRVLVEELGEVAKDIDRLERSINAHESLQREVTQLAAVCVQWLETPPGVPRLPVPRDNHQVTKTQRRAA